jgi:hypothetical protein
MTMRPHPDNWLSQSRRSFLTSAASGLGAIALRALLNEDGWCAAEAPALLPKASQHTGSARAAIFVFLAGGPSQVDLCDPKPLLRAHEGKSLPESIARGKRFAFIRGTAKLKASRYRFGKYGQCGMDFSELVPNLAKCADDLALVRSMQTDTFNHLPGHYLMSTGSRQFGRPSVGAWVLYGLGSASKDLPGYVVLTSGGVRGGGANWSNGFLPPRYQGVRFSNQGDPVLNLSSPPGITREMQRTSLDALERLNRLHADEKHDPEITGRIAAYELAFRMQASAPKLFDTSSETQRTLAEYGVYRSELAAAASSFRETQREAATTFARNCLLARRLVEAGVRFVTIFHGDWDHHNGLHRGLTTNCQVVDQPIAALIKDLKQRGLLESTLVVVTGEFGRTCLAQGDDGRDHHPYAFSTLLAGGGIRPGTIYGKSDDFGFNVDENPVHVHDFHATLLHLFGLDHLRLTYRYQGRDMRLTDVAGKVVEGILASGHI